jgi:hypothetical protein
MAKGTSKYYSDIGTYKKSLNMNNTTPSQKSKIIMLDGSEDNLFDLFKGSNEFSISISQKSPFYNKMNNIRLAQVNQTEIYDFSGIPLNIRSCSMIGETLNLRASLYIKPRE